MNEVEKFLILAKGYSLRLEVDPDKDESLFAGDVLFHTPIISLALLTIVGSVKELNVSETPNWIGYALSSTFWGAKKIRHKFEWSIVLRNRYADSLLFLESSKLITVKGKKRTLALTDEGRKFVSACIKREEKVGQLVRGFRVAISEAKTNGFNLL